MIWAKYSVYTLILVIGALLAPDGIAHLCAIGAVVCLIISVIHIFDGHKETDN